MAVRLFKLRDVPDDEAEDVRHLLAEHGIDFYETYAGNWGIGTPAIWLKDESRLQQAKALIDQYQGERAIRMRAEYEQKKQDGRHETMLDRMKAHPVQVIIFGALTLFIVYVTLTPFLNFGK